MKIFYSTQITNHTLIESMKEFRLNSDACWNICVGIVSNLIKYRSMKFLIAVPFIKNENYYNYFEKKYYKNIEFIYFNSPVGAANTRFHFDYCFWEQQIDKIKLCNVMINDSNTLTKNWKVLFNEYELNIPIISTNYFLDSPIAKKVDENIRYYERMMESLNCSDLTAFQCESSKLETLEAYDYLYKNRSNIRKTSVWNIGCWYEEVNKFNKLKKFPIITIYFANRITNSAGRYNNYHKFAEAIGIVKKRCKIPFDVWMLNPTRKITKEQLNLINNLSNNTINVISNNIIWDREDYLKFINQSHISCNLFTNEVQGGIACGEALATGNIVICPKINHYWYRFQKTNNTNYPFFCSLKKKKKINISSLANKIELAINEVNNGN